ncbi:uncharacterized protein METZ01_LOCUS228888, partial [marine metagenome]
MPLERDTCPVLPSSPSPIPRNGLVKPGPSGLDKGKHAG